jgi:hypothetical protein
MFPVIWSKALLLFLWISPHVLLGVLAVALCKRRWHREYPCFFVFVLYEIIEFALLFTLYFIRAGNEQYAYAFTGTLIFSIALRFGVIDEVSRDLFRESQFLRVSAKRLLQCSTGVLLLAGSWLTVYTPGVSSTKWYAGIFFINRGAAMVQSGMLLSLLLVSRFLGLSWRRPAFAITLGLGILSTTDLAMFALRAAFTGDSAVKVLDLLITGAYFVCVAIWTAYSLAPEPKPASPAILPRDEVEIWNMELQHLLRD